MAYETLFGRFTRVGAGGHRPRDVAQRGSDRLQRQSCRLQALACLLPRHGRFRVATPVRGPEATFTPALNEELRAQVAAFPDATLPEHAERWNAANNSIISHWTISGAIRHLGLSHKKSRSTPASGTQGPSPLSHVARGCRPKRRRRNRRVRLQPRYGSALRSCAQWRACRRLAAPQHSA
jgi:transposase